MKKSLLFSATLHLGILFAILHFAGGNGGGSGNGDGKGTETSSGEDKSRIADKPIEVVAVPPPEEKQTPMKTPKPKKLPKPKKEPKEQKCDRFFGGIGITYSPYNNVVITAHPGYPAYEAGIRDGDIILEASEEITGPVGTPVVLIIQRGQDQYRVTINRGKICVEDQP